MRSGDAAQTDKPDLAESHPHPGSRGAVSRIVALWEASGLVLILLASSLIRILLNRNYDASMVMRDEAGYLANAAAFAGHVFDGASSYHAGYSLLILPAFLSFDDPLLVYRGVQAINLLLAAIAIVFVDRLLRELFPHRSRAMRLLAVGVAASYPAWFAFSGLAMSENATVPVFCIAAWLCLRTGRQGGTAWIAWALACGFLFVVHPGAVATIAVAMPVGLLFAAKRREWPWFVAFVAIVASMIAIYSLLLQPWLVARLTVGSFPPSLHYPSWSAALRTLLSIAGIVEIGQRVAGHVFYLLAGSLWLAWSALAVAARSSLDDMRARMFRTETCVLAFVVLPVLATLALSVLSFSALHGGRFDHWMYGRYMEGSLMPALAIGFLAMSRFDRVGMAGMLVAAACAVVLAHAPHGADINSLNVSALWPSRLRPEWPPSTWWLMAATAAAAAWLLPSRLLQGTAIAAVFMGAVVLLYQRFLGPCHDVYAERFELARFVRDHVQPAPDCVGLDVGSPDAPADYVVPWAKYGTHLFGHGLRRTTVEEWQRTCDGPLISWSRDLDRRFPGMYLAAVERHDLLSSTPGPYLWVRKPVRAVDVLNPGDVVDLSAGSRRADWVLGKGWHAPEAAGVWSSANAQLWLEPGDDCVAGCTVDFMLQPLRASESAPMEVTVRIEGIEVARWRIVAPGMQRWTAPLMRRAGSHSAVGMELAVDGAVSPRDLGMSADPRVLGIKVRELRLSASDGPHRRAQRDKTEPVPEAVNR